MDVSFKGRLGVELPRPEDRILIKTMMQLYALRPMLRTGIAGWTLVDEGPFDAMVCDEESWEPPPKSAAKPSCPVLLIVRYGCQAEKNCIARPIRADDLYAWLDSVGMALVAKRRARFIEKELREKQRLAAERTPALIDDAPDGGDFAPSSMRAALPEVADTQPRPSAITPAPAVEAMPAAVPKVLGGGTHYKLTKWPPASLLRNESLYVRIASLLSRHPLELRDLVWITGAPKERCEAFLQRLKDLRLLRLYEADAGAEGGMREIEREAVAQAPAKASSRTVVVLGGGDVPQSRRVYDKGVERPSAAQQAQTLAYIPEAVAVGAVRHAPQSFLQRGLIGSIRKRLGL